MVEKRAWSRVWCGVLVLAAWCDCTDGGTGTADGGAPECTTTAQGPDCSAVCNQYCSKLRTCGVSASSTCVDDCRTITEAGGSTSSYACVVEADCPDVSNCGI